MANTSLEGAGLAPWREPFPARTLPGANFNEIDSDSEHRQLVLVLKIVPRR
jgi:hypothetical protein